MMSKIKGILLSAERSEKSIEAYLARRVKAAGGLCLKYSNPLEAGYPDRLCIMPGGVVFFVELKSKGQRPRELQRIRIEALRALGLQTYVADSRNDVNTILQRYAGDI